CSDGECVGKTLSGEVGFKILRVDTQDVGDDAAKVTGVQVEVTNGKSQTLDLYADVYAYVGASDVWFDVVQGRIEIEGIKSGETIKRLIPISGKTFADKTDQRTLRVVFEDSDITTVSTKFKA
ncbi:MAG: hypothetical protein ABIH41_01760, partial [Nanoarchaeota archaeon]